MALPDKTVQQAGSVIVIADSTDYSPAANNNLGTRTHQMDLTDLAAGDAWQTEKFDFGVSRALSKYAKGAFEFATGVVAGEKVAVYLAASFSATAAVGNPGGVTGVSGAYTGTAGSTLTESLPQLQFIGNFNVTDDSAATVQQARIGKFSPPERYGSLVIVNLTSGAFHSDMDETSIALSDIDTVTID